MAAYIHHMAVTLTLLLSWLVISTARIVPDIPDDDLDKEIKERNRFLLDEFKMPDFAFNRPYRAIRKIIKPRALPVGQSLITARGYGKRGGKHDMELMSARTYGKRSGGDDLTAYLCAITKCHEPYRLSPNLNDNVMTRDMMDED